MTQFFSTLILSMFSVALHINSAVAAPPAKAFGELPVGYDAAISPNGEELAIIVNIKGTYGVIAQKLDGSTEKPWYLTLGKDIKPAYVKWVNNHRFVVSVEKSEKYRNTPFTVGFLFTGDLKERKGRLLVEPKDIFRQFNNRVVDWLEDDPEHILMAYSDEEWDAYPDIKKVNVETSRDQLVKRGQTGIEYWTTDDTGTPRIGTGQKENGKRRRIIYNTGTDKWESVDEFPGIDANTPIFGMLKDGTELVIGDYRGKNTLGLYVYSLTQKQITRSLFHNDNYDASGVVLSKDGETVIGANYTAESDKTELLGEYGTLLDRLKGEFPDYDIDFVDQTEDSRTVLVKMSAPYDPGGLYVYKSSDKHPTLLTKMYNDVSQDDTGDVVAVKYTARDGQKIPAFVTLPPGQQSAKNLPFIIMPHGGPYARDSKRFDYLAQFFATRGYGVLQMNFRGSEGYGKAYADAGRNNWIVMQQDVEDGHAARDYWEPLYAEGGQLVLDPDEFYILASKEAVSIPQDQAAEMAPIAPEIGEFRAHYAGFFDPGFGVAAAGGEGSRAVLEVRGRDVPFLLRHGQPIAKLVFEAMSDVPASLYGEKGSHYQAQNLRLSKHFKDV